MQDLLDGGCRSFNGQVPSICKGAFAPRSTLADTEIVMVDLVFGDDFEQDRSWDDFGTIISGISGTHQHLIGSRMPLLLIILELTPDSCNFDDNY